MDRPGCLLPHSASTAKTTCSHSGPFSPTNNSVHASAKSPLSHMGHACRGELVGAPKRHLHGSVAAPLHRLAIVEGPLQHAVSSADPTRGWTRRTPAGFQTPANSGWGHASMMGSQPPKAHSPGVNSVTPVERRMARVAVGHTVATAHRVPFFRASHVGVHELGSMHSATPPNAHAHTPCGHWGFRRTRRPLESRRDLPRKHGPAKIHPLPVNHPIDRHALWEVVRLEDRTAAGGQPTFHVQRQSRQQIGRRDARLRHTP